MAEKILLVDDEPEALRTYQSVLAGKFEVETAPGGKEALASLRSSGPYAVVISDVQMPGMDGIRLLELVRQSSPNTVRMILSEPVNPEIMVRAVNACHIFHFLNKPCEATVLADALREALGYYRGRREKRIRLELPLLLYRSTCSAAEPVHTVDISTFGARIAGVQPPLEPLDTVILQSGDRKAAFRVIWVGTKSAGTEGEAGVQCVTPDGKIWAAQLSQGASEPMQRDMAVARAVQTKLLPSYLPRMRTLEYSGRCLQARTIGGDYYDFIDLGEDQIGFVLADVAGKGIPAAILMANLHGIVRSQFTQGSTKLAQMLGSVNRLFYRHTETYRYATLFLACYDDHTRKLHYINCGHNPPLLLRTDGAERLEATATVLGLFQNWECSVAEVQLEAGNILSLYTDGLTEACSGDGEEFGEARLLAALRENRNLEAAAIVDKVGEAVRNFSVGEQADDLTLVIARAR